MFYLPHSLSLWNTPEFSSAIKREIEQLDTALLPLQQGLATSSHVADGKITVLVLSIAEDPHVIRVTAGILYAGIIAGCSCADDPTPLSEQNEYCEVLLEISRRTAETRISLLE